MKDENFYLDRDSQILAINKTFEAAKKEITSHPGKPGVKPVEILPVFPDFDLWKYPFAQVMFDADPAPMEKEKQMSQAMIRGVMDESGEQFVAYFLPTEATMDKRKIDDLEGRDYIEEEEYEYNMAREYNWNVKNKGTKGYEENYFFIFRDDGVYYNELETRVKLSKRRVKHNNSTNSKLLVKHRQLNDQEYKVQAIRMTQLEPPQEEEDELPAEEIKEEEKNETEGNEEAKKAKKEEESSDSDNSSSSHSPSPPKNNSSPVKKKDQSDKSSSSSSSEDDDSKSESSDSDDSDDDESEEEKNKKRKAAAEIFGSDSD